VIAKSITGYRKTVKEETIRTGNILPLGMENLKRSLKA